jgi:hypothetical protein
MELLLNKKVCIFLTCLRFKKTSPKTFGLHCVSGGKKSKKLKLSKEILTHKNSIQLHPKVITSYEEHPVYRVLQAYSECRGVGMGVWVRVFFIFVE